jgi:phosphopantothenoylcysteine decarboxylase/phosphopantothenate--cysteine ligase
MATKAPVMIAPAMNCNMYVNPIYRENEEALRRHGYRIVAPATGLLACGWEGVGKLQEPGVIFAEALAALSPQDLAGERIVITAGPTVEEIDPVRFVSNHSSGKMGYAIARAAWRRGAQVTLISGPTCLDDPWGVETVRVSSAVAMRDAVLARLPGSTVIVKAAAVADYRPTTRVADKIKKQADTMVVPMEKNPDILSEVGKIKGDRVLVGFAAETGDLVANARVKLAVKNVDLMVANDISQAGAGFNVDTNIVKLLHRDGRVEDLPLMAKEALADVILDRIRDLRQQVMRAEE